MLFKETLARVLYPPVFSWHPELCEQLKPPNRHRILRVVTGNRALPKGSVLHSGEDELCPARFWNLRTRTLHFWVVQPPVQELGHREIPNAGVAGVKEPAQQ